MIGFLITTHNRQRSCQALVDAVKDFGTVYVVNDGCEYDIIGAEKQLKRKFHFGKKGYWATVNELFKLRGLHRYYFMLPDDFLPTADMVKSAIEIWEGITDDKKICLNLYADRVGKKCWTLFNPKDAGKVYLTQWVDMCFLCEERFFQQTGIIPQINLNWNKRPSLSSGVGAYISKRLHRNGYHLYQVKESLVIPQEEHYKSQMHKPCLPVR